MKVTVLCNRPSCTPPHPCSECQHLAGQIHSALPPETIERILHDSAIEIPGDRTIVLQVGPADVFSRASAVEG